MSDAYIQLDGIKGQASDDAHKDWIEIIAYDQTLELPIQNAQAGSGGREAVGRVQCGDLVITKQMCIASPDLAFHCASGKPISKAELHLVAAAGTKRIVYLKVTLTEVFISKYVVAMKDPKTNRPTEDVSLNYGTIKWEYTKIDEKGGAGSPFIKGWNRTANKEAS